MRSPMKKLFVLGLVSSMLALGCELIVDFDRTKIVGEEVPETGPVDGNINPIDANTSETSTPEAGADADAATDAPADAPDDGG